MARVPRYPRYCLHKPSGLARVIIDGEHHYLGKYGSEKSHDEYRRLMAERTGPRGALNQEGFTAEGTGVQGITIVEIAADYLDWAQGYYLKKARGGPGTEADKIRRVVRTLNKLYAELPAEQFSPNKLRAFRQDLLDNGVVIKNSRRHDLARSTVNKYCKVVCRLFKWAVSRELVNVRVYQAICTVEALRVGRTAAARETKRVTGIDDATIDRTLEFLPPVLKDMVRIQRLTGCRPTELCIMRRCDVDTSVDPWCYVPHFHKTEHHGHSRRILIGPRAQAILAPYLARNEPEAYLFSPRESERLRHEAMRESRKSDVQPSQRCRKKRRPQRSPGELYNHNSYNRAVGRACEKAFPCPDDLPEGERDAWRKAHKWQPNQLRHSAGEEIRAKFDLEAAQPVLGHSDKRTTERYAPPVSSKAAAVIKEVG